MIQKALKTFILLFTIIFPMIVAANSLNDEERNVRKYVSRTYQATDGALGRCSSDYIDTFNDTTSNVSRDYELEQDVNEPLIVSVYGGKITTFRKLAEEVMDLLKSPLKLNKPAWTENSFLPGCNIKDADFEQFFTNNKLKYNWLDEAVIYDYCRNYGTVIDDILEVCEKPEDLGEYFGAGLYECETLFLIENEWAQSSDDILWRRSKKGLRMSAEEIEKLQQWLIDYYNQHVTSYTHQ